MRRGAGSRAEGGGGVGPRAGPMFLSVLEKVDFP